MKDIQDKFFQLLRLAIDASSDVPDIQMQEWKTIYEMAEKQSLLGIVFDGIGKMGDAVRMDSALLVKWLGQCKRIERWNHQLNEAVINVSGYFNKRGFGSCILKGQGNALMYPNPLHRTPGDIDIWLSGKPSEVIRFVHSVAPHEKACYHHIDFPAYKGIPIEVHYRPCYLQNMIYNARLQRFFRRRSVEQFRNVVKTEQGSFAMPTTSFNIVYQLVHIYNHLLQEGIGMRQLVDYYFVMLHADCSLYEVQRRYLKHLGLCKFAGAVMYVLHEVLGLSEKEMIVPVDEKRGMLLLDEIMQGGNFGHHTAKNHSGSMTWRHNIYRLQKDLRLMWYYPSECMAEPFYRLWHFIWRMRNKNNKL